MWIFNLKLKWFRCYQNKEFNFIKRKNIISGDNGSGKTSILEAIYILSFGKSFRTNNDIYIKNINSDGYFIKGEFKNSTSFLIEVGYNNKKKKIKINNNNISNLKELIGKINTVMFLQKDLDLIDGSPETRRKFINALFSQIDENYFISLIKYNKLLFERNILLKNYENSNKEIFDLITERMIKEGEKIFHSRIENIKKFNTLFKKLIEKNNIDIKYLSNIKDNYYKEVMNNIEKDISFGYTTIGPHRDDILVMKDNIKISEISSTGEKRYISLMMKLSEYFFIKEKLKKDAIILMDDILLELDKTNIKIFLDKIDNIETQFLITTTEYKKYMKLKDIEVYEL